MLVAVGVKAGATVMLQLTAPVAGSTTLWNITSWCTAMEEKSSMKPLLLALSPMLGLGAASASAGAGANAVVIPLTASGASSIDDDASACDAWYVSSSTLTGVRSLL